MSTATPGQKGFAVSSLFRNADESHRLSHFVVVVAADGSEQKTTGDKERDAAAELGRFKTEFRAWRDEDHAFTVRKVHEMLNCLDVDGGYISYPAFRIIMRDLREAVNSSSEQLAHLLTKAICFFRQQLFSARATAEYEKRNPFYVRDVVYGCQRMWRHAVHSQSVAASLIDKHAGTQASIEFEVNFFAVDVLAVSKDASRVYYMIVDRINPRVIEYYIQELETLLIPNQGFVLWTTAYLNSPCTFVVNWADNNKNLGEYKAQRVFLRHNKT